MNSFVWVLLLVGVAVASASNSDSEVSDPHTEQCKVGDTKFKDCNFCKCTNGAFECTEKKCPDRGKRGVPVAADLKNTPCAPNDYFKIDCNTCYCNIEKTGYLCTENLCPLTEPPATDAPPNNATIALNDTVTESTVANFFNTTESISNHSDTGGGTTPSLNVTL
ncbi:hypothetical protein TcasGA2_TC015478 [Tribolium castaneum]|uniref:Pacifastin domain-containing protein n=2 Tax=Tribolium castaneum TaxID=7070 RepID=D2A561_TRICA|nr:PREDICTED: uncharacterized protein LOC660114 isoform X1 [Tribolium castaneum]EFA05320.1 hypothetical protein TcasGA2_TC015478 [Tribolium castaneum]|eukprot:XP_015838229.1 PREDICTED: uncharacterized protein LOC660114 isoform X1 [Tribolium castaneum]